MSNFSEIQIFQVWQKAIIVPGYNMDIWRKDFAGAWIHKDSYGKETPYGWEIDHRKPVSIGGTDDFVNLFPMQWKNNRVKGDSYPMFDTAITSMGNHNVDLVKHWKIG